MRSARAAAVILCLTILATGAALATTVDRGEVKATCTGYTAVFDASGFDPEIPGEYVDVTFRVVLTNGAETRIYTKTVRITANGSFSFPFNWIDPALGYATDPCGDWTFLSGGADGSRYDWVNNSGGSGADALLIVPPSLSCSCEPPAGDEICRTPGFWATHAGTEKDRSQNITFAVIGAAPGSQLDVCGKVIKNTDLASILSAEEAMCVSPRGDKRLQLARHLTAAALNCVMSGGTDTCSGVSIEQTFAECNSVCTLNSGDISGCIAKIDCFNNGGSLLPNGMCATGTCSNDGDPCKEDADCHAGSDAGSADTTAPVCVPDADNCHRRALVNPDLGLNFDPPGPAGSPKKCNDAEKNKCTIFSCS